MGLLDYYRQFDDMSDAEVSDRLLRKRDHERAKALADMQYRLLATPGTAAKPSRMPCTAPAKRLPSNPRARASTFTMTR